MIENLRFYGRRKGRALNPARQAAFERVAQYTFTFAEGAALNPATLFSNKQSIHLEIGFGGGEHLVAQAAAHPHIGFIGAEPFEPGIARCIQQVEAQALTNVRVWPNDVRPLLDALKAESIDCIYILFSDPWPKARHADRRFVSPANMARLARVLKQGGTLRIATDDPKLQEHTEEQMAAQTFFTPAPDTTGGLFKERPNWPNTRYESKAMLAKRESRYYEYTKQ